MSKVIYVNVRIVLEDDTDVANFTQEVDYDFSHPGVVDTEIVDVSSTARHLEPAIDIKKTALKAGFEVTNISGTDYVSVGNIMIDKLLERYTKLITG